jgi:hypothetical protein
VISTKEVLKEVYVKIVKTRYPSFPDAKTDNPLIIKKRRRWQVICGDRGHYRVGAYSPEFTSEKEIKVLEKHSCDEFFMLINGSMSLLLIDDRGKEKILKLEPLKPVFVRDWHNGFCEKGQFTGMAIVVERDEFTTEYRTREELTRTKRKESLR